MPMPLEILVKYKDGQYDIIYIPISLMRGEKNNPIILNGWSRKTGFGQTRIIVLV